MSQDRYSHFIAIVGAPGRGKTTAIINPIEKKISKGDRALVIIPDRQEKAWYPYYNQLLKHNEYDRFDPNFKGVCILEYKKKHTFPFLLELFENGDLKDLNLILDDPKYARKNPEEQLIDILARQRQYKIDTWTNAHGFDQLPPDFFEYITIYGVFFTNGRIRNRVDDIPEIVPVKERVDRIAGVTPKEINPNFHYVEFVNKLGEKI